MLFVDKYKPKKLDDMIFHKDIVEQLKLMCNDSMMPNLIFCGPSGAGKSLIINFFLEMIYDNSINNVEHVVYKIMGSGNIINEIKIKQSNYHIVIEPNNNNFDKYLIQDVIKEYAKHKPIDIFKKKATFHTVLINNVHNLSYYAQTSLRRTMEKCSSNCRFILCADTLTKVLEPICSRCIIISIRLPSDNELIKFILNICDKENIILSLNEMSNILHISNGNIKEVLWLLNFHKNNLHVNNLYNKCITNIAKYIINKRLDKISVIIDLIYKIIITGVNKSKILKDLLIELCNSHILEKCKYELIIAAAKYENRLIKGRHEIIHLQSFIYSSIKIMINYT